MIKSKVQVVLLDPQQGYLDVDPNTEVPFTFSVSNVKDLTQKNGTFSKTIKLSGTKNNNQLLNNYFDVNVIDGTFNINRLQKVQVLRGGVPVLKEGYLQLVSVEKVQNSSNSTEQLVEYNVLIKDTIADLFTKINPLELTDLEFGYLDHTLNAANVISSFTNDVTDEYKYVLPYSDSPAYKLNQFKPGIYAKVYWDKIIDGAGFTYEWTAYSADTVQFDKLIIPYNGDELKVTQDYIDSIKVIASKSADTTYTTATTVTFDVETQDPTNAFDPATGIYTNQFYIDAANNLTFTYEVEYEVRLVNPSASPVTLYDLTTTSPQSFNTAKINYIPKLNLKKGNTQAGAVYLTNTANQFQKSEGAVLSAGTTSLGSYTKTVTLASNSALPTNTFKAEIEILSQQNSTFNQGSWRNGAGSTVATTTAVTVTAQVVVKNINLQVQPNLQSIAFNSTMRMNTIVPKKVKQSQFVKDIMTMYNLFVEVDENDSNRLIFKSRDEYYDSGIEVDWTRKLAKNMKQQVTFLPQVTKKRLIMTYKHDDADVMLKGYKDNVNEIYGQVEYTFDSDYVKEVETKELGFSPVTVGQPSWGPVLPFINGVAPKTNIKIAINGAQYTNANSFSIENYPGSSATTTTYPLISHFDAAQNPSFDLNYALNDYYYYGNFGSKTNNNLYNLYWRRTINQINNGRMLTAYFHLTEKDINRLKLNQKVFINNAWWNINQIIDYKAGKDELTKVELLSIDDSIKFAPFKTRIPRKPIKGDHTIRPIRDFIFGPIRDTNVFISDAPSVVTGKNNFLGDSVKNSTIIGDDNKVYSEKSLVLGDNNEMNSDAFVVGSNNIVNPDLKNVVIFGDSITADTSSTLYAGNLQIEGTINGVLFSSLTGGTVSGDYLPLTGGSMEDIFTAQTISMSAATVIKSTNGGGQLDLDYGGSANNVMLSTDSGGYANEFLYLSPNYVELSSYGSGGSIEILTDDCRMAVIEGQRVSMSDGGSGNAQQFVLDKSGNYIEIKGRYNSTGVNVFYTKDNALIQSTTVAGTLPGIFIGSSNSRINSGVTNSIILGGSGITGTTNDTVYVPNLNIQTIGTGTSINNLGIDALGNVVVGSVGGSGATSFNYWTSGSTGTSSIRANNSSGLDATGDYAVAEGYQTLASGNSSHAEGFQTQANGQFAHAEGYDTRANGDWSHAEGAFTIASGIYAHAEGGNTLASSAYTHAEGHYTEATGYAAHAGGWRSVASGNFSFAHGDTSKAAAEGTVVLGKNITGTTANTTYVDRLNIKTIGSSSPIINLGIDSSGNVVTGTTGGSGGSFTGGTVAGATTFQSDVTLNTIGSGASVVILGLDSTGKIVSGQTSTASVFDSLGFAVSDETTAITSGTSKLSFRMPYQFQVTGVTAYLTTTGSTTTIIDVNRQGSTIFSSPINLTSGQYTTTVTNLSSTILYDSDVITVDIDAAGTGAKGLKLWINGYRTQIATVNNTGGLTQMQIEGLI